MNIGSAGASPAISAKREITERLSDSRGKASQTEVYHPGMTAISGSSYNPARRPTCFSRPLKKEMHGLFPRLILLLLIAFGASFAVCAQTVTFSGRVTEQATGQGIAGAAVVGEANQTGVRVAVTDAQGNYTLSFGSNTNIRLRAYKTNYFFNPALVGYSSLGGFPLMGSFTQNFSGTSFPVLILARSPVLLTEDNSLNALVLDNVIQTRDPFSLTNENYFGADKRTRLTLLLVDLDLYPNQGETISIVTAQAQDTQAKTYPLAVEDLRKVPNVPWMTQLVVRLPSELVGVTDVNVTVTARGLVSHAAKLRLK